MKRGTLSLLFGVHQFLWHPIVVGRAWRLLYGRWPSVFEWVAIITHDLGYWGLPNMDGKEGVRHPLRSQNLACWVALRLAFLQSVGRRSPDRIQYMWQRVVEVALLVRYHSREMVKMDGQAGLFGRAEPSLLCWPDKFSIMFEPEGFYLFRARLTGELEEFRQNAIKGGHLPKTATGKDWFRWYRARVANLPQIRELLGT